MKNIRIISRLDIKGPNVVKPIQTEALRVVGNPKESADRYYREGADELIYLDIVASLYQRNLDFDLLKSVAENIFIPITVGGGIRSIYDISNVLRSGADKVAINTYAVKHPNFLSQAVREFGSQCIVLYVEAKKQIGGKYEVYTTTETQQMLKISSSTIKRMLKKKLIRANKVGGQYRILGKEILRLVSPEIEKQAIKSYLRLKDKVVDKINKW